MSRFLNVGAALLAAVVLFCGAVGCGSNPASGTGRTTGTKPMDKMDKMDKEKDKMDKMDKEKDKMDKMDKGKS